MASKPWFDARRGWWVCKYRPDPTGPWLRVNLCRHPAGWTRSKPPRKPPQEAIDRARHFEEIEYRAKHGMAAPPPRARPLAPYLADYRGAFRATRDASSFRQLDRHLKRFESWCSGRAVTTVQGVTKVVCRDYLEWRIGQVMASTLRSERGYLMGVWSRAVEDGLMDANPWAGARVPGKIEEHEPTFWTSEQVAAIARHCARPWQADLVLVLANTGIRISAALAMEWSWIDWSRGVIAVPAEHSKGGRSYKVAMSSAAHDILARRQAEARGRLVFPNPMPRGGVVGYDTARSAIERAIERAGVPRGTPHDLRHSYGRHLHVSGAPLSVVKSQLGHSTVKMTERYTTTDEDQAARFVDRVSLGDDQPGRGRLN